MPFKLVHYVGQFDEVMRQISDAHTVNASSSSRCVGW